MGGMIQPIDRTMMAVGGRVGFANGSPDPVEEMATLKQAIAALEVPRLKINFYMTLHL